MELQSVPLSESDVHSGQSEFCGRHAHQARQCMGNGAYITRLWSSYGQASVDLRLGWLLTFVQFYMLDVSALCVWHGGFAALTWSGSACWLVGA